jgi:hypothetical protein
VGEIFAVLDIFLWDIFRDPPPQFAFKYQNQRWDTAPQAHSRVSNIKFDI